MNETKLLESVNQISREDAELLVCQIRERRIVAVERYKEALRLAAELAAAKQQAKALKLLTKIGVQLTKSGQALDKAEAQLRAFDIGDYTLRTLKK